MSYMGHRYNVGGGGQIFPQGSGGGNQAFQSQQQMRQYQVMQMQMQIQQKLQMQKQQQQQVNNKNSAPDNSMNQNKGPPTKPNQNQPNAGSMNRPNASTRQPITAPSNSKPSPNQNDSNSQRTSMNPPPVPNQKDKTPAASNIPQTNQKRNQPNQGTNDNRNQPNNPPPNKDKVDPKMNNNKKPLFANKPPGPPQTPQQQQSSQPKGPGMSNTNAPGVGQVSPQKLPVKNEPVTPNQSKGHPNPNQGVGAYMNQLNNYEQDKRNPHQNMGPGGNKNYKNEQGSHNQGSHNQGSHNQGSHNQGSHNQGSHNQGSHNQSPKGRPNQNQSGGGYNNMNQRENSFDDHSSGAGGNRNFSRPPPNAQKNTNQNMESFNRPGRNAQSSNDYQSHRRGPSSNYKGGPRNYYGDKVKEKALQIFTAPLTELEPLEITEKKFNAYARLFIGNIPKNCEQKEVVSLFEKYGEIGSVYLNKDSSFAFINLDFKANAAKAMRELDNTMIKNRFLKVRFATINEGIRVKNLSPYVSNELLEKAFSIFGMIESCRVVVDDRGNPKREGIILFRDKKAAVLAVRKCQEECFFLSGALRPVVVTPLEASEDNVEGFPETSIPKNEDFHTERQIPPHFADSGSFEFEFGVQWKQLFSMYDEKKAILDRDFQIELERLEKKMVLAKVEYETDKLRKELAQREAESAQLRRHFEFSTENMGGSSLGPSTGTGGPNYDSYSGGKRPLEQGYDSSYSGPYDPQYNDNYDRGTYPQGEYERGYEGYGREDYRREGGYSQEDPYERPHFDRPAEVAPERIPFEAPVEQGYASNPTETPVANEPYKAPNKRPRY